VDRLEIHWPSGQVDVLSDISADQKIRVIEGRGDYHVLHPTVWERRPPTALVAGSTVELTAVVRPAPFEPSADISRVTADLSSLGGPRELDLISEENGTYRLHTAVVADGPNRVESVWVTIEQTTSLGPYWTRIAATVEVWPAEDLSVFRDAVHEGWALNPGRVEVRLTNPDDVDFSPAWSPDGTSIAFTSIRDGSSEIYVINADGTNQLNLTNHPAIDGGPEWSPDGTRIAFHRGRQGEADLYVMDATGGNPLALTNQASGNAFPAWSPDGSHIAFQSMRDGDTEVYVMDSDGGNVIRLTQKPGFDGFPSWSRDSSRIAFVSDRDGNNEVYVMNADGSNPVNLTVSPANDFRPTWSPDGTRIAFSSDRGGLPEIHAMNADGSGVVQLTGHADRLQADSQPSWSPDGTKIAFWSWRGGAEDIYWLEVGEELATRLNPEEMGVVYEGTTALEVIADGQWSIAYTPSEPQVLIGYDALHFALHPGDVTDKAGNDLRISLNSGLPVNLLGGKVEGVHMDLSRKQWQSVEIPLSLFALSEPIEVINISGSFPGTFYLDDVRLVRATPVDMTVVEEEKLSAVPEAFALDRTTPTPSTVAPSFTLPCSRQMTWSSRSTTSPGRGS
jgi:Tol biopolymer transport system component